MTVPVEGFVFGLASSLHCAAMCGPIALFAAQRSGAVAAYHGCRFASYLADGGVLGA
jgi:sulfite exporter TauE/SafE